MGKLSFFDEKKLMIGGHRGSAGVAPENTLVSFQRAFDDGADFVEMDLREGLEGEVLIIHDEDLERTTDGQGAVRDWAFKHLKSLDAGHRFTLDGGISYPYRGQMITIPTLEEFFTTFPGAKVTLDVKEAGSAFIEKLVAIIKRFNREGLVLLSAAKGATMREIRGQLRDQDATIATGFSYEEADAFMRWVWSGKKGSLIPLGHVLQVPCMYQNMRLITEQTLKAASELNLEVHAWTVNDSQEMEELIRMGVGGIVTDYPARLKDLQQITRLGKEKGASRVLPA